MRVLHVQKVSGIGGSERHLLTLLPALAARGLEVRMCVLGSEAYPRFVEPVRERGVDVTVLPAGRDVNPKLVPRLQREIRGFRPDLVHTHLIHADLYGQVAARLVGVPGASTIHSTNAFYRRRPIRSVARASGRLPKRTIAISEHAARFVRELGLIRSPESLRVIHYGIDAGPWLLTGEERKGVRADLGLADGDIAVGVASRLFPNKGHRSLIAAFARALERTPRLRLLVAGDGPLRRELEEYAHRLANGSTVRFLGHVEDIRGFMNGCDVVAFPSLPGFGEGFGLAALEAMASGRPVVATAVDSLAEIVVEGETGALVSPGDVEGLAEALVALAEDPTRRERLGMQGHRRAVAMFGADRMVDRTIDVYREVVADAPTRTRLR